MYLVADTETTGLDSNARIAQMAFQLYDENRKIIGEFKSPIKPDGWVMPAETAAFHGITQEFCEKYGLGIQSVLALFNNWCSKADVLIFHNQAYDVGRLKHTEQATGIALNLPANVYCTMRESTDIVCLPPTEKMLAKGMTNMHKPPSLKEAHLFFTGEDFDGAHDAMADVRAAAKVFFGIQDHLSRKAA